MASISMNVSKAKRASGKIPPTNYGALSTLVIVFFFGFIVKITSKKNIHAGAREKNICREQIIIIIMIIINQQL